MAAPSTGQVQADQLPPEGQEQSRTQGTQQQAHQELEPEGVADARMVLPALELGGEDARTGGRAENTQVEHEHELVDDGHTAHGNGPHLPHHHIVEHLDKIRDAVLDHDGQGHGEDPLVELLVGHKISCRKSRRSAPAFHYKLTSCSRRQSWR